MKKILAMTVLVLLLIVTFIYREDIVKFYTNHFIKQDRNPTELVSNAYYHSYDFKYVKNMKELRPHNQQDVLNIYYTILNSGATSASFYCPEDYQDCITDVKDVANNQTVLSNLNNFVHPYNSFKHIETEYDSLGRVKIIIEKTYTPKQIEIINKKVDEILKDVVKNEKDPEQQIKLIHDYIINNSKYDAKRSDDKIVTYQSDIAYGNLIEGYGLCGGYTDSMAIFLNAFKIENYKISSENHVWNAVKLNDTWLHLDLTWDDPITTDGTDILEYNFFLISDNELQELKTNQHEFNHQVYQEI